MVQNTGGKVKKGFCFYCCLNCFLSSQLICRASLEHPHHTLFIIFALVNANKDENFCRSRLSKSAPRQPSQFDLVGFLSNEAHFLVLTFIYLSDSHISY